MTKRRQQLIGAAIDVGSNSVHALIARYGRPATVARRGLSVILDQSRLLGLGDVVDAKGRIPLNERHAVLDALIEYIALARENGAQRITLIGTEPLRRAANGPDFAVEVLAVTGLPMHIISVRVEAELTFLGATGGHAPAESIVVVDIGGGSTEIGVYSPGVPFTVLALAIGSARLTNAIVEHDPPTESELARLHQAALDIRSNLPVLLADGQGRRVRAVFVGGTATNLARLGHLTSVGLAEDRLTLARLTGDEITKHFGVRPRRARQLAAGAAIVEVLLDHFELDEASVSDASLRDGAVIAAAHFGDSWPGRLTELIGAPAQAEVPSTGM